MNIEHPDKSCKYVEPPTVVWTGPCQQLHIGKVCLDCHPYACPTWTYINIFKVSVGLCCFTPLRFLVSVLTLSLSFPTNPCSTSWTVVSYLAPLAGDNSSYLCRHFPGLMKHITIRPIHIDPATSWGLEDGSFRPFDSQCQSGLYIVGDSRRMVNRWLVPAIKSPILSAKCPFLMVKSWPIGRPWPEPSQLAFSEHPASPGPKPEITS